MSRLRKIREPERFSPPRLAAAALRQVADRIEQHSDLIAWSINISYATEEEVRESLKTKAARAAKAATS